jgi:hypothetical protein
MVRVRVSANGSSNKLARRRKGKAESFARPALTACTETGGQVFDDCFIELTRDAKTGRLQLFFCKGEVREATHQVIHGDYTFRPLQLDPSLDRSLTLPTHACDYGTSLKLFQAIRDRFRAAGFADFADALTLFILATWLTESLIAPPLLVIMGARAEANYLLQLLACLARRSLSLVEPPRAVLSSVLSNDLSPTLLIRGDRLPPNTAAFWLESALPASSIVVRHQLINTHFARAIFLGESLPARNGDQNALLVELEPAIGRLPGIRAEEMRELSAKFQPQLLEFRLRNFRRVRKAVFDVPKAPTAIRMLAAIFGAAIADVPELREIARRVLDQQQQLYREAVWFDLHAIVVEAALARCHEPGRKNFRVGEIAEDARVLLSTRGDRRKIESRAVGSFLRSLGLAGKRRGSGYTIELSDQIRHRIHSLARSFFIPITEQGAARCPQCLAAAVGDDR